MPKKKVSDPNIAQFCLRASWFIEEWLCGNKIGINLLSIYFHGTRCRNVEINLGSQITWLSETKSICWSVPYLGELYAFKAKVKCLPYLKSFCVRDYSMKTIILG